MIQYSLCTFDFVHGFGFRIGSKSSINPQSQNFPMQFSESLDLPCLIFFVSSVQDPMHFFGGEPNHKYICVATKLLERYVDVGRYLCNFVQSTVG